MHLCIEDGLGIRQHRVQLVPCPPLHIFGGDRVVRKHAAFAAHFGRHVAKGKALGNRQVRDSMALVLEDLVKPT